MAAGTLTLEALVDQAVQQRAAMVAEGRGRVCLHAEVVSRASILLAIDPVRVYKQFTYSKYLYKVFNPWVIIDENNNLLTC